MECLQGQIDAFIAYNYHFQDGGDLRAPRGRVMLLQIGKWETLRKPSKR